MVWHGMAWAWPVELRGDCFVLLEERVFLLFSLCSFESSGIAVVLLVLGGIERYGICGGDEDDKLLLFMMSVRF
jgi:hypothetical protein